MEEDRNTDIKKPDPKQVMDLYYLEARCEALEIAATLDRLDRAYAAYPASETSDLRVILLREALQVLSGSVGQDSSRTERMLKIFSKMDPKNRGEEV